MIIDSHGHYTTAPRQLQSWREAQLQAYRGAVSREKGDLGITDEEIRASIENSQLRVLRERGIDVTLFSPRAAGMAHHEGDATVSRHWSEHCNDLVHRVCKLFPEHFVAVCQLPQAPDTPLKQSAQELERCVTELGFVGCNLNPDTSGGYWRDPPLTDRFWYPIYEKMAELDVPAFIHTSSSCNPAVHFTGAHYINGDVTAFMQLISGNLFKDFPTLKFIIPHGGGAAPYHWGRYRGLAQMQGKDLKSHLMDNVFFDTCVYHQPGIDLLTGVIPVENVLFASEMVGAVRGIDPETGFEYDDTRRYIEAAPISDEDRRKIFEENAYAVFPRLRDQIERQKGARA